MSQYSNKNKGKYNQWSHMQIFVYAVKYWEFAIVHGFEAQYRLFCNPIFAIRNERLQQNFIIPKVFRRNKPGIRKSWGLFLDSLSMLFRGQVRVASFLLRAKCRIASKTSSTYKNLLPRSQEALEQKVFKRTMNYINSKNTGFKKLSNKVHLLAAFVFPNWSENLQ